MSITTRSSGRAETALVSLILGFDAPSAPADAFYTPPAAPAPPRHVRPGDLVRAEPTTVSLLPGWPLPATRSWRIAYRSTSATGDPMAVTGTLMVPTAPWPAGARPLVAYAVGGHGMGRQCIPSVQFRQGTQVELAVVAAHLAQGWAAVVTDYQRTPAHTFLNAPASGHAVLDAARAALRVPGTGLGPAGSPGSVGSVGSDGSVRRVPVGIAGYGHGGLAAAAAAERQPAYAPELDLRGVTVGGVPGDLAAVLRAADGTDHAGLVPMVLASLRAAYPTVLTTGGLSAAGRDAAAAVARQCTPDVLARWAGRCTAELTGDGVDLDRFLATRPAWRDRLDEQELGRQAPRAPVLVFHGLGGTWVPYGVTRRLADAWRAGGTDVRLAAYPAVEHGGALVEAIPQVHHWLGARLTA
jgi:secretory lipase